MYEKYKKSKQGGKVLASGGFGCVFFPALKCKNNKTRKNKAISKLMTIKHADKEYAEIVSIKAKLKNIPNYKRFFLVYDIDKPCEPNELTQEDLIKFKEKCSALPKNNITYKNINKSLNQLKILNVPYGGIAVDDYLNKNNSYANLYQLNNSLVNLLKNGIIPMNQKYIFHCDIKDSNILVDNTNQFETRLIDWGLSTSYIPFKNNPLPNVWKNRSIQYNVPFSVILFSDIFINTYTNFINTYYIKNITNSGKIIFNEGDLDKVFKFVLNYVYLWLQKKGLGHYKFINKIINMINKDNINKYKHEKKNINDVKTNKKITIGDTNTIRFVANYITQILINFTYINKDQLNLRFYLDEVFIHNIDIWGFVSTYIPLLEMFYENMHKNNKILDQLQQLFLFLYNNGELPIKKEDLIIRLNNLNNIFKGTVEVVFNKFNKNTINKHTLKKYKQNRLNVTKK